MARNARVAVVGAGVAGMAAAHRVCELARERRRTLELTLVDAARRVGGTVATERIDGFVVEAGADSFLSEKPWALELCQRLGISHRLVRTREGNRRTFVAYRGRLHPLPEGFLLLAPTKLWPLAASHLFSWLGKIRMGMDLVLPRGPVRTDESLGSFVTRRLGREALERVAQPLVGGIYTADPDRLSLAATMPRFLEMERKHRSLIWAMARQRRLAQSNEVSGARWSLFVSFDSGMEALIEELAARLPAGCTRLGAAARTVRREEGVWRVALEDGTTLEADALVLATPSHVTANLLRGVESRLSDLLCGIRYASAVSVSLGFRETDLPRPLDGFGFVVPAVEGKAMIACTFSSVKYPGRAPEGHVLLRAFMGGVRQDEVMAWSDEELMCCVRAELRQLLEIEAQPLLVRIHRHPAAMPQYDVGHLDRVAAIERLSSCLPGLALAGNAYRGVGVPDCIRSGEVGAETALRALEGIGGPP